MYVLYVLLTDPILGNFYTHGNEHNRESREHEHTRKNDRHPLVDSEFSRRCGGNVIGLLWHERIRQWHRCHCQIGQ